MTVKPVKNYNPAMQEVINVLLTNPFVTQTKLAQLTGFRRETIAGWLRSDCFKEEWERQRNERWGKAIQLAEKKIIELIEAEDWRAIEYMLKTSDKNPISRQQVEVKGDSTIKITIDEEGDGDD